MMKLNLCMMLLKKILDINYTYGYLKQPMAKNIWWGVPILFISQIMGERGVLFITKGILPEGNNIFQRK